MTIDETCLLCPFKLKKEQGQTVQQFSDHNAMVLNVDLPRSGSRDGKKNEKIKRWKMTEEGLHKFTEITNGGGGVEESGGLSGDYNSLESYLLQGMD